MAEILYDEEKHEYTLDGEIVPSVTQLAQKFSGYDTTWLQAHPEYAQEGTEIHNELAEYYAPGSDTKLVSEKAKTMSMCLLRDPRIQPEVLVYNTKYKYAGTADIVIMEGNKCLSIFDWKTGIHNNNLYCRCQLSLYYLALKEMGADVSTTKLAIITPDGAHVFEPFTWAEMQGLLADYSPDEDVAKKIAVLERRLDELSPYVDTYEDCKNELKEILSKGFEDTNTRKFNGEHFMFTFIPKSTRKSLDQKKVAEALGDTSEYMKETEVAATVRIKEI